MKLALLSFHNAANYGAALQAYALQTYLEKKGFDCEYIDYVNKTRKTAYSMSDHIINSIKKQKYLTAIKYMVGTPFLEMRKMRFKKFYKKHLKVSRTSYTNASEASKAERLYDKFIVGSDQVWCSENNGSDVAYLLSFIKDSEKKISYSSSFGKEEIPIELYDKYVKYLKEIKHLSTREKFGVDIIKKLTGRDATLVMDPVFLLTAEEWKELITKKTHEKFLFSYTNTAVQLPFFLKQTNYPLEGKKIYKLSTQTNPMDFLSNKVKVKYTMSPQSFLQYIHDAEFVVTASFHCLAFSILFHKQFAVLISETGGNTGRLTALLDNFGLMDRVITDKTTLEDLKKPIDWKNVDKILNEKLEISRQFLLDALCK